MNLRNRQFEQPAGGNRQPIKSLFHAEDLAVDNLVQDNAEYGFQADHAERRSGKLDIFLFDRMRAWSEAITSIVPSFKPSSSAAISGRFAKEGSFFDWCHIRPNLARKRADDAG